MRAGAVLLVLAVLSGACSSGGGGDAAAGGPPVEGSDEAIKATAQRWIDEESGLTDMLKEEIFFDSLQRAGNVTHVRYIQAHGGVAVRGAQFIVHVLADGTVQGASNSLVTALPADDATEELTQQQATDVAVRAVTGTVKGTPRVEATWLQNGEVLRLGWQVFVSTTKPAENWAVVVDATNGSVLSVNTLSSESIPLSARQPLLAQASAATPNCQPTQVPAACIFVPDPPTAAGGEISPDATSGLLVAAPLELLTDPASGRLEGRYVNIIDAGHEQPDGVWGGDGVETVDFAAGSAYYWVTYTQQLMTSLGFPIHGDRAISLEANADLPNNAQFLFEDDLMQLGTDRNGISSAEDAAVMIHEYGHGVLHAAVGFVTTEEGRAVHEATGDTLALLTTLEFRGSDPGCVWFWYRGAGRECGRRADLDKVYPQDLVNQVHQDGQILTGAVWDLLEAMLGQSNLTVQQCADRQTNPCDPVRDRLLSTMLGSLGYLTPDLTLNDAAAAFKLADQAQFGGTNAALIDQAFAAHGLSTTDAPTTGNNGDTGNQGATPAATLSLNIQHERLGDLALELRVVDPAGTTLCSAASVQPNPANAETSASGTLDVSQCAAHLPPSPERRWVLHVADTVPGNVGQVISFEVAQGTTPYPAPSLPVPIPDGEVTGIDIVIDGTGQGGGPSTEDVTTAPTQPEGGNSVVVELAISHARVGDLQISAGVQDADGVSVCSVLALDPDPQDVSVNVAGQIDLSECADHYPPRPDRLWFLRVVDTALGAQGSIDSFRLAGPDGRTFDFTGPGPIPDGDLSGAIITVTGS